MGQATIKLKVPDLCYSSLSQACVGFLALCSSYCIHLPKTALISLISEGSNKACARLSHKSTSLQAGKVEADSHTDARDVEFEN